jgi:ADP-heptose:LPS heptosyltransferase
VWKSWTAHPGVVLHPAATQRAKEWPLEHAVELVRRLGADAVPVLVTTAPGRSALTAEIVAQSDGAARALPLGGLREVWAVVAAAAALVAVDGGIAHAGVALGRPTVALFGPTVPEIWFPYESFGPYRVLHAGIDCGSCDRVLCVSRTCMAALEPRCVLAALAELWSGPVGKAAP